MQEIAYEKNAEFEDHHFWFVGRRQISLDVIKNIMHDASIGKILDYGCGTGGLLQELQKIYKGKEIYGADVSDIALAYCRKRRLSNILDLKNTELPANSFDLIICQDVLEHVQNDVEYLAQIKDLLRKEGRLLVTVPAHEFLWSGEDYVSKHFRRYTRRQLRLIFNKAGFQVIKLSYFNSLLFIPLAITRLIKRIFFPKTMYMSDLEEMNPSINKFLSNIFALEKWFLRYVSFPFGASIIAVVKK